jgi:hypothetical protein
MAALAAGKACNAVQLLHQFAQSANTAYMKQRHQALSNLWQITILMMNTCNSD